MYYTKRILATMGLVFSSAFVFGQIKIGTAANFILFTSVGAITNTGPSHFVGVPRSHETRTPGTDDLWLAQLHQSVHIPPQRLRTSRGGVSKAFSFHRAI